MENANAMANKNITIRGSRVAIAQNGMHINPCSLRKASNITDARTLLKCYLHIWASKPWFLGIDILGYFMSSTKAKITSKILGTYVGVKRLVATRKNDTV